METERWTMVELVARVAAALDGATYAGAPNGRVRDVPDARAIRWYATIGLVDRPAAMRGRTALYGPRHLLQLVAIKRRQAAGLSIAEIQAELAGAPDDVLREFAGIPDEAPGASAQDSASAPTRAVRPRFWAGPAPTVAVVEVDTSAFHAGGAGAGPDGEMSTALDSGSSPLPESSGGPDPMVRLRRTPPPEDEMATALYGLLTGIPLGGGAVLLVPSAPQPTDLPAIAAAARPLIDVLVMRGLVATVDLDSMLSYHPSHPPSDDDPGTPLSTHHSTDSRTDVTR